jgi:hypothetical protein
MESLRCLALPLAVAFLSSGTLSSQVIEFESGGLRYLTQTKNGVTVMFAPLPVQVREYAVIQVAISNGSPDVWTFRPEDFSFLRADGSLIQALPARRVVQDFISRGSRTDVVKLVTAYESGLYGMNRHVSTNGYEQRRQAAFAEVHSTRIKAAAAASAIVMVPVKLKSGESTDGAVFYPNAGKPLGPGKLILQAAGAIFEFETGDLHTPLNSGWQSR